MVGTDMLDESHVDFNVSHNGDVPRESPDRNKPGRVQLPDTMSINLPAASAPSLSLLFLQQLENPTFLEINVSILALDPTPMSSNIHWKD